MSDGDNAAPGRRAASGSNGDHQPVTRSSPGAAPWERWQTSSRHAAAGPAARQAARSASGNHADGALTVADLIARVGGTASSSHRHAAPEPEEPEITAEPDLWQYDDIARIAYASEPPDLDQIHGPHTGADPVPPASHRVPPVRVGQPPAAVPPAERPAPTRRPMLLAGRTVAALMAVLALALTGGAWQWSTSKNNSLNRVSALDPNSHDIVDPNGQYGDENFLIVGTDTRAGANSDVGAGDTEDAGGARSDTIMLVNIPANRKRVVTVSFPRDLAITPIKCEAWNPDTGAYGPLYDEDTKSYGSRYVYT
ncbi:MAG: LCP family protein, partial [Mycobacterium sp.]